MTRRAGVVGSPVDHSLSPVLHRAAYAALGLADWVYDRTEVPAGRLSAHVAALSPEWVGLSVTMPGKEEALALAATASEQARLTGAANTLVRDGARWAADNTDVTGLLRALQEAGVQRAGHAVVLGSGATARSAVVALQVLGVERVTFVVRDRVRDRTLALAQHLGMVTTRAHLGKSCREWGTPDVVVSTLPPGPALPVDGADGLVGAVVFDVGYAGWPTPWARELSARGVAVAGGEGMLVHQAVEQVRLMTGRTPPVEAMRAALREATRGDGR